MHFSLYVQPPSVMANPLATALLNCLLGVSQSSIVVATSAIKDKNSKLPINSALQPAAGVYPLQGSTTINQNWKSQPT